MEQLCWKEFISSFSSSYTFDLRKEFKNLVLSLMNAGGLKYIKIIGLEYYLVYTNE